MKVVITPTYAFSPSARTLDLSAVTGFDIRRLLGVVNATKGAILYAPGLPGFGCVASGAVLTLAAPTLGMSASDQLLIVYDDGTAAAADISVQALATLLGITNTKAEAIRAILAGTLTVGGTVSVANLPALVGGKLPVAIDGESIVISSEVEVKNDVGSPIPTADAGLGTDGSSPPALPGGATGVRGWLRQIWATLSGTLTVQGNVTVSDGSGPLTVDGTVLVSNLPATQAVSASALPLPSGAATAVAQATGNASLASVDGKTPALVSGRVPVDGSGTTQPVSASALPLPAGAATSAKQDAGTTVLGNILTALGSVGLAAGAATIGAVTQAGTWAVNATLQASSAVIGRVGIQVGGSDVATANPVPTSDGAFGTDGSSPPVLPGGATGVRGWLRAILAALGNTLTVQGTVNVGNLPATQPVSGTFWQGTQPVSAASLPLPAGAATAAAQLTGNASLAGILTAIQAQRSETLWTDDTGAFFVRLDTGGGTVSWTDPSGTASSAPGTGARPAGAASLIIDSSRYQATAGGTGFSVGDYLSHVVTTDPATGVVIGHFWLNVTTEAKLSSGPSSASITPIAALPAGGATSALQSAGNTTLGSILAALGSVVLAASSAVIGKVGLQVAGSDVAASNPVPMATKANAPRVTASGSLAAANATATLALDGMSTGIVQLAGTWAGTVAWQGSVDGGANYFPINMIPYAGGASTGSATANGQWECACGGLTHLQAIMTAYTSGTATALLVGANGQKSVRVGAPSANPVPVTSPFAAAVTGQVKIVTTNTAVPLPSTALVNGVVIKAKTTNAPQTASYSGMVGPTGVTTTFDGTGGGYALAPGEGVSFAVSNANQIYVNGTAGDVFTYAGN